MHKRTDTTINLFIDKLDNSGVGISLMQNENVCLVPYTLPGERVKVNIINKFKSKDNFTLAITPELSLWGYPPRDLLYSNSIFDIQNKNL